MTNTTKVASPARKIEDVSSLVIANAIKAAGDNDSASFNFATSVAFMMIDANSRAMARGDSIDKKASDKRHKDVFYTLTVKAVYAGVPVYAGTSSDVAEIASMPKGTDKERNARIAAAREHVDGKWTLNGAMLPPDIDPSKDTSGRFVGAERKSMVSSFQTARKLAFWIAEDIRDNSPDTIRELGGRKTTSSDVEAFQNVMRELYATFADMEHAYKSGKPRNKSEASPVERLQTAAEKLKLEELVALQTWLNAKVSQLLADAADIEDVVNLDIDGAEDGAEDMAEAA